jgi:hypothetical protein
MGRYYIGVKVFVTIRARCEAPRDGRHSSYTANKYKLKLNSTGYDIQRRDEQRKKRRGVVMRPLGN